MIKIIKLTILILIASTFQSFSQIQLNLSIKGIKYEDKYEFDAGLDMEMVFYSKKGAHRMTIPYESYYSNNLNYLCIKILRKNTVYQTLFDFPNNNCIIILGEGSNMQASSAVMKDNEGRDLNKLPLTKTTQTKEILGYKCVKYTFQSDKFDGEIWATNQIELPNDVGILKASKMGKYFEDTPVEGFILEITSITRNGLKTVMKTTEIHKNKNYSITLPNDVGSAINKIDYYDY